MSEFDRFKKLSRSSVTATSIALWVLYNGVAFAVEAPIEHPDFSGIWAKTTQPSVEMSHMVPLTPEGQRLWARNKKGIADSDPNIDKKLACMPPGFPASHLNVQPVAIFQSTNALAWFGENTDGALHLIYIDAAHNPNIPPQIEGDAVGHWEGDTLVADTVNLYDGVFLGVDGIPKSKALHVFQRFRLIDGGNTLEEMMLIDDPVIFTKPWSFTFRWVRTKYRPPEKFCNENRNVP